VAEASFRAAMRAAGLEPAAAIDLPAGSLVRFGVSGDKPGSRNGWAIFHAAPVPAGVFGSWRTGESHVWRGKPEQGESAEVRAERRRLVEAMQKQRKIEQARIRADAQARAVRLWHLARPATDSHPYLRAKRVHCYGVRQLRDMLVIPVRDAFGVLHSLQFIGPDGAKRFLSGGRLTGCYYGIGRPAEQLLLGEGYATCATLHMATGAAVAVCFNCGNLEPVARSLRAKFPRLRLVVCADNDVATPGNPGLSKAMNAARAIGGAVAVPRLREAGT
jgi:putative DNA primase/helicase